MSHQISDWTKKELKEEVKILRAEKEIHRDRDRQRLWFMEALNEVENIRIAWPDFNEHELLNECIETAKLSLAKAKISELEKAK